MVRPRLSLCSAGVTEWRAALPFPVEPDEHRRLIDVFAATLPDLAFQPGVHVNYAETVLPMKDGLPKLRDFPKEFGGSGEAVPE